MAAGADHRASAAASSTVEGDLAERGTAARLAAEIADGLGTVDVLVNNAGIAGGAGLHLLADYDDEQWYRTVDVNLNAVYLVTKAFLPGMVAGGRRRDREHRLDRRAPGPAADGRLRRHQVGA